MTTTNPVIIGAGPAGLTACHELLRHGVVSTVVEADDVVGGLARTVDYKGYLFDIGGHRFFTKWAEVDRLWHEILGEAFVERRRLSRIYYRGRFFSYPLKPLNALLGLGWGESALILASYARARLLPSSTEQNFEQWVSNRFGKRLYETFFKSYTEKVWGVPCTEIGAEWAAQRIKSLSLGAAVKNAFFKPKKARIKSLIDTFHYPARGPGQMWQTMAEQLTARGCRISFKSPVQQIHHDGSKVTRITVGTNDAATDIVGTHFISSMPVRDLVNALVPAPPEHIRQAGNSLRYRDFIIVNLIMDRKNVMPDNWVYVHDPAVKVGRIQNFKNWSPDMVPDPKKTCLGMEYFVSEQDQLWKTSDGDLLNLAADELVRLGLIERHEVCDGTVLRVPKAYPVYANGWGGSVREIANYLGENLPNLQLIGRNGMHKYNNQDHSMMTALYAARNILGASYDLWAVNTEPEYHEQTNGVAFPNPPVVMQEPKDLRTSSSQVSPAPQS
jgi:protoporphyrinogen oxidase